MAKLSQPATKKDIFLLKKDVSENTKAIQENRKEILAFKWEITKKLDDYQQAIEKKITEFKDVILRHLDPIAKELETTRKERTIMGHQI